MSKAFLLLALALVIACASAANFYATKAPNAACDAVADSYFAAGQFIFKADTAAKFITDNQACADALPLVAADIKTATEEQPAACWNTDMVAGGARWCGIAVNGDCSATTNNVCVEDAACLDAPVNAMIVQAKTCQARWNYVFTVPAETKEADLLAAVKTIVDGVKDADAVAVCTTDANAKYALTASKLIDQLWVVVSFETLAPTCLAELVKLTTIVKKVNQDQCTVCADWFATDAFYCPCVYPEYIITSAKFTLVEGKKQGDLEKLFGATECIKAKQFINVGSTTAGLAQVVVTTVVKYKNTECDKEGSDRRDSAEYKAVVSKAEATFAGKQIIAKAEDCSEGAKITKCATDAKCEFVPCAKSTACTTENAGVTCASLVCTVKEGETAGKCNSASVVGYVVAVVAVIAAFVF